MTIFSPSPILKLVINRTLPLTVGVFAIMLVQLVDTIFIGLLGVDALAVQGITLPFNTILIGVQVGIGVAATSIISRASGDQNKEKANITASISVLFGIALVIAVSTLLWLFQSSVFSSFVSTDALAQSKYLKNLFISYWPIWLASSVSGASLYLVSAVYRANEDSKTSGFILIVASVINLLLDPILIFHLNMGINGAAIATFTAYLLCTTYLLVKARSKRWFGALSFSAKHLNYLSQLLKMTSTTTVNQILPSISAFLSMLLISRLGTSAIAFWSLISRFETFVLVFTLSLTMSIPPIVGRYSAQGNINQVSELLLTTVKFLLGFHVGIALVLALSSSQLALLLSSDPLLSSQMEFALMCIPLSYGPLGLCMVVVSTFNALNLPNKALHASFVRLFILYLPAVAIGTQQDSIPALIISVTSANFLAGIFAWKMFRQYTEANKKFKSQINV